MLAIRDDHNNNYFNDKFVHLCHINYFINGDGRKLTTEYICDTFYTLRTKFYISIFQDVVVSKLCT